MKIEISYKISEVSADEDLEKARDDIATALVIAGKQIMTAVKIDQREAYQAKLEEEKRWKRFMYFCHTGVML